MTHNPNGVELEISRDGPKRKFRVRAPSAYDVVNVVLVLALARACGFSPFDLFTAIVP